MPIEVMNQPDMEDDQDKLFYNDIDPSFQVEAVTSYVQEL